MEIITNIIRIVVFCNSVYMPFFFLYKHFDSYSALKDFNEIIKQQNDTITTLSARLERLDREKWNPYRQIWDLRMQVFHLERSIESNFTERMAFQKNNTAGVVAFQAYYGDKDIIPVTIGDGSVVTFSDVRLNDANGYNCSTGTFIVPGGYDGLYQFSVHLLVQNGDYPAFQLRHNSLKGPKVLCNAAASFTNKWVETDLSWGTEGDAPVSVGHTTVSCNALARVSEGDQVYVWHSSRNFIPLSTQPQQSAFSGFYIKSYNQSRNQSNNFF